DAHHVDRAMAHAVIAIAREVLRGKLPVARDQPLVDAADRLGATLASVPAVEQEIEIELVAADVGQERRRRAVPGRPDRALVVGALGDLDESPSRAVELLAVCVFRERHADQGAVGAVAPAVVRALELDRVALVVPAHLHAAMPARVEEDANAPRAIAAEDDRLLAHRRGEIVAGLRDLALVTEEEPGAGEDALELLAVDLVADEDLAADHPALDVD